MGNSCMIQKNSSKEPLYQKTKPSKQKRNSIQPLTDAAMKPDCTEPFKTNGMTAKKSADSTKDTMKKVNQPPCRKGSVDDKRLRKRKIQRRRQIVPRVVYSYSSSSATDVQAKKCWKGVKLDAMNQAETDVVQAWKKQELRLQAEYKKATENVRNCLRAEQRAKAETETWRAVLDRLAREHREKFFRQAHVLRTKLQRAENLLSFYEGRANSVQMTNAKLKGLIDKIKTDTKVLKDESEKRRITARNNMEHKVGNLLRELERLKVKFTNVSPSCRPSDVKYGKTGCTDFAKCVSTTADWLPTAKPPPFVTAYSRHCNAKSLDGAQDRGYKLFAASHIASRLQLPSPQDKRLFTFPQQAVHIATRPCSDVSRLSVSPFPNGSDASRKTAVTSASELINLDNEDTEDSAPTSGFSGSASTRCSRGHVTSVSPNYVTLVNDRRDVTSLYCTRKAVPSYGRKIGSRLQRSVDYRGNRTSKSLPEAGRRRISRRSESQPPSNRNCRR